MCSALYCVIFIRIPSAGLAVRWYGDTHQMRITQSISLSNIQTFLMFPGKARPKTVKTCR